MPSYTQTLFTDKPLYLQGGTYTATMDRKFMGDLEMGPGVTNLNSHLVNWTSAMGINVTTGTVYVWATPQLFDNGMYRCRREGGATAMTVPASDPTNPRLDQVIVRVMDAAHDTSGLYEGRIEIVPGTPTAGATLDNRNGAANLAALLENSQSTLLLADILVPAGAVALSAGAIRDRRRFSGKSIPNVKTFVNDQVLFEAASGIDISAGAASGTPHDLGQSVGMQYCPRYHNGPTRIRWSYSNGATALAGNYIFAIYDHQGRLVVASSSTAFAGAANTFRPNEGVVIAATAFYPGWYYVLFGMDATNAGTISFLGYNFTQTAGGMPRYRGINQFLGLNGGGVTAPTTLGAFADITASAGITNLPGVPLIGLTAN